MRAIALVFLHLKIIYDKIKKYVLSSIGRKKTMGPGIQKTEAPELK